MSKAWERPNQQKVQKWVRKDVLKKQEAREWAEWEKHQNSEVGY